MRTIRNGALLLCTGVLACSDPTVRSALGTIDDPSRIYARLDLSYHAITLRVEPGFDTMTLTATPRTPTGAVLPTSDVPHTSVTYRVANNHPSLTVNALGQLQARATVSRVLVIASQTIESVTFVDTAVVSIVSATAPRPAIASVSMQPFPGDSAKVDCSGVYTDTLVARALDAVGAPVTGTLFASYRSSDPLTATISATGVIQGWRPGVVTLVTDAFVAGQGFRDSVQYTISDPLLQTVWIVSSGGGTTTSTRRVASPGEVVIAVGGRVFWMNASTEPVDILFDTPDAVLPSIGGQGLIIAENSNRLLSDFDSCPIAGGGNIPMLQIPVLFYLGDRLFSINISCPSAAARRFTIAGTYSYHSTDGNIVGRVSVR